MSNTTPEAEPRKSRGWALYVLVWMLLGGIAAGYLVALAVEPELVAQYLPAFRSAESTETVTGEVRSLRDSVSQVQMDVARLSTEMSEQGEHVKTLDDRVGALESRPAMAAAAVDGAAMAASGAVPAGREGPPGAAEALSAAMGSGAAPAKPAEAPAPAAKSLETGSVGKDAPAASGPPKAAARPTGVQIGTAPSVDALRLNWLALSDRHGEALKDLQPRYITGKNENGDVYKLIVGPVKNTAEAKRICEVLETDGVDCSVRNFQGNTL